MFSARAILQVSNKSTTQNSIRQFASGGATRRKRGSRQRQRNLESVNKSYEAINSKIKANDEAPSVPQAFFILAVFPIVAMGGMLFIRDDLRQDFKEQLGLNWN